MKILRSFIVVLLMFLISSPKPIIASVGINGTAEFYADATPGFLKIHAVGGKVTGEILTTEGDLVSAIFKSQVKDYTTDLELRDDHMRNKYMEAVKYPDIILSIKGYRKWDPKFSGDLSFHGQTHKINGNVERNGKKVKATFDIKVTDFGVAKPQHLGVGMDETIKAVVEFEFE